MLHSILFLDSVHKSLWELSGCSPFATDDSIFQRGSSSDGLIESDLKGRKRSAISCPDKLDLPDSAIDVDDLSSLDGPSTSPDPVVHSDESRYLLPDDENFSDRLQATSSEGSQETDLINPYEVLLNGDTSKLSLRNTLERNGDAMERNRWKAEPPKANGIAGKPNGHGTHEPEDSIAVLPSVKALRSQFEVKENGNTAPLFPKQMGTLPCRTKRRMPDRSSSWNESGTGVAADRPPDRPTSFSQTLPIRRSRSVVGPADKTVPELIQSLGGDRTSNTLPKPSQRKMVYGGAPNGTIRTAKPIFSPDPPESPDDVIPSIIAQFGKMAQVDEFAQTKSSQYHWDPSPLLKELYEIQSPQPTYSADITSTFINIEGYLDKLPSGRKRAAFWNAWKRRYFRLKDGCLYYYQSSTTDKPSLTLNLMGGHVDSMDTTMLGIDDGKGHYVVVRCINRQEMEQWRVALQTHTIENFNLTYVQPVPAYPHFYEDVIIIDVGSCSVRAGILCNQPTLPQLFFPTVFSVNRETGKRTYGIDALTPTNRNNANVLFPLRPSGKITKYSVDLEAINGLLTKVFTDLDVDPQQYQVQLSLPRNFTVKTQTEILRMLFSQFEVRAVNLTTQTVLSLLSYNATSGIVVDIGERLDVIPIIDGYVVEPGVSRIPYGGARIMDHLRHFLLQRHYSLVSDIDSYLIRYVLEQICYCAEKYNEELQRYFADPEAFEKSVEVKQFFTDPPWDEITLDNGTFQASEGLFNPDAWGLDNPGIHKLVHKAIQECSLDIRKEMTRSIYLSGGLTLLPGFASRLESEVDKLTPPSLTPKVHNSPYRYHAAYLGACVLAGSPGFQEAKITRDDWIHNGIGCLRKWHL